MNPSDKSIKQSNSSLNEDFWAELDAISESDVDVSQSYSELDEDNSPNKSLEDLAEADWLREAGLQDIIHSLKDDSLTSTSTSLDDLLRNSLPIALTERQTNTVRKRFNTLRSTIIKQKAHNKRGQEVVQIVNSKQRPDVRSLFNNSDNADSTRVQPIIITDNEITERDGLGLSSSPNTLNVPPIPVPRRGSSPDLQKMSTGRERTHSTPPEPDLDNDLMKYKTKPNYLNISKSTTNLKKESSSRFSWSGYKKAFRLVSDRRNSHTALDTDNSGTGIEALSLKYNSSLRGLEGNNMEKNIKPLLDTYGSDFFASDHITAQGLGIEVVMNPQTQYTPHIVTELRLNSYVSRLEDLSPEMRKKVRTLAMIELSTVLDMYGLEFEKTKSKKSKKRIKKNSENVLFGVPLEQIYGTDLRRDSGSTLPSILKILFNYIRMNGLHEEGIFRINGSQNRVLVLKQELERLFHLYYTNGYKESTEEIFAVLNKYTIYDICSVLKQFIRELPDPLLTQDLLEAFILVPKITDFLQQIQVLNLLILLINDCHRNTLEAILYLFNDITDHENLNKMTVHNIATIMAPNLFPVLAQKKRTKQMEGLKEMETIMERAKDSFYITKTLVYNHLVLFHVPPYLIAQIQRRKK